MNTKKIILSVLAIFAITVNALAWGFKFEIYDQNGKPLPDGTEIGFYLCATAPNGIPIYYRVTQTAKTLDNFLLIENGVASDLCKVSEPQFVEAKFGSWAEMESAVGDIYDVIIGIDPAGGNNYTIEGKKTAKIERQLDSIGNMPLANVKVVVENSSNYPFSYTLLGKTSSEIESKVMKVPAYSPIYFSGKFVSSSAEAAIQSVKVYINNKLVPFYLQYESKDQLRIDIGYLNEALKNEFGTLFYKDIPFGEEGKQPEGFTLKMNYITLPGVAENGLSFDNLLIGPFEAQDEVNIIKIKIEPSVN